MATRRLQDPTVAEWFNTAAFGIPTACFGDSPRNIVIGPGAFYDQFGNNQDGSISDAT